MGKMILCSGKRTEKPYLFTATGTRIYSIEELCRYLYTHFYLIDRAIFLPALFEWIDMELELGDRAEKLKQLVEHEADLKTIVTVILCSSDYYSEQEIKALLKLVDEIEGMPRTKRNSIRARHMLEDGLYLEAAKEYERIVGSQEATELSPGDYGDILHHLAVAKAFIGGPEEAGEIFRLAYEHNRREETFSQYLYALCLSNREELFREKIKEYEADSQLIQKILQDVENIREEVALNDSLSQIRKLRTLKSEGKVNQYHKNVAEILEHWKSSVRIG